MILLNFWDSEVWSFITQIAILMIALFVANVLIRKIPVLRKSLLPTAVVAGLLILIFKIIPCFSGLIDTDTMEIITYHCLGLGFIATVLRSHEKTQKSETGDSAIHKTGLLAVNGYLLQGIIGLALTLFMAFTVLPTMFEAAGLLLPMGFGQGPGQALNFGSIFESKGFENGSTFGLTIATVGFLVACLVGVITQNYLLKKGKLHIRKFDGSQKEAMVLETGDNEIGLNDNIDKFTLQIAIVIGIYFVGYLIIYGLSSFSVNFLGEFGESDVMPLLYGFNYLFGIAVAVVFKKVLSMLKNRKVMEKDYLNNFMLNRISGFMFDLMIVAGIASLVLSSITSLLIPILIICLFGTVFTFVYVRFVCNRLYKGYSDEMFFAMFGTLTGTLSTGMVLLRQIDPMSETPASNNMALHSLPAIAYGFALFFLIPYAGNGTFEALLVFGIIIVLFIVFNLLMFDKFKRKKKIIESQEQSTVVE